MMKETNKIEKIAKIKYGSVRFEFFINNEIQNLLKEKSIETQKLIPTASFWYKSVLKELGLNHKKENELKVLFFRNTKEGFKPEKVIQSPLRIEDGEYLLKIGVKKITKR